MEVQRPAKSIVAHYWKCYCEFSEVRITVKNVGKRATCCFVCLEEDDVILRYATVELKKKELKFINTE
jgi:hypothetical protein